MGFKRHVEGKQVIRPLLWNQDYRKKFTVPRNSACGEVPGEGSIYGGNTASPVMKGVQMESPTTSAMHISSTANAEDVGDRNP